MHNGFIRVARPSRRAVRPRSNWLVMAASVIGGPCEASPSACPAYIALSRGNSPEPSSETPYSIAAATIAGSASAIAARVSDSMTCRALPAT
jgi:hypothetical protein